MNEMILEVSLVKHLLLLTDTVLHPVIYQLTQGFIYIYIHVGKYTSLETS
jgi:hypothetical protein